MVEALVQAISTPFNLLFLLALAGVTVWAFLPPSKGGPSAAQRLRVAPGILTSIGILGTFTGILIGLLGFDTGNLEASVPQLLEGMTTAFLSSVAGLALALAVRGIGGARLRATGQQVTTSATLADLQGTLLSIDRHLDQGMSHLRGELVQVRDAIGGKGDSTLLSQITLMRQEQSDAAKRTVTALEEFAAKVSELGSKALIEALKTVIQDFNRNLTEQFGDNFKHLNAGVERLVLWQQEYREHLETMQARLEAATTSMHTAEQSLQAVVAAVTPLPAVNQQLLGVLAKLEQENNALEARLAQFAALGRQAVDALPVVQANIERLTTGFADTVSEGVRALQAAQRQQVQSSDALAASFQEVRTATGALVAGSAEQQKVLQRTLTETLTTLETQLRAMHSQSAKHWQEILKEQVERQQDAVRQQLDRLDSTLRQQLTDSLDRLSAHLLGLHQKLVQDYDPLLASIRQVVEIGRRGNLQ